MRTEASNRRAAACVRFEVEFLGFSVRGLLLRDESCGFRFEGLGLLGACALRPLLVAPRPVCGLRFGIWGVVNGVF